MGTIVLYEIRKRTTEAEARATADSIAYALGNKMAEAKNGMSVVHSDEGSRVQQRAQVAVAIF